ncbi:MAG: NEAT domain-containing protein [Peptoniphilaceae bacterium]|uniref:NEAT domain-containing protein n=1 Tax=Aedoeadaptatus acetigenes TaxID=2981723 RepID=UPI0011DDF037|nr:NEAT domain-containing protein [Aedoeadaptatus acetigenes]MBS6524750.1 NEAT domain-containing protein [Peptoniphilaceae bacterium]MCU6786018.1 NEAT domain-containing protein [Aedoeadaptatus acetigenes]
MKRYKFILLLVLAILLIPGGAWASGSTVKVMLLKKTEDVPSMAQKALNPEAKWIEKGNERLLTLEFLPLDFMGTRGYLGEVTVEGQGVQVADSYKDYDSYNDPQKGSDPRMKGKLYPKTVTFSVDPNRAIYDLKFYVPVMGEMGFGEQEARLKIDWPHKGGEKTEPAANKNTPPLTPSAPLDFEDGLYALDVALWHETEDKPSMGNGALDPKAELFVKDGKGTLFLGTKTLKVSNIQASLSRVFYETDEGFSAAAPLCFDLKPENEPLPRPRIFALPLEEKKAMIRLKVDPKVAPMGDEPLNARLKLDFQSVKKIEADENTLAHRAEVGPKKPSFAQAHRYADKGVVLSVPEGAFSEGFEFYANALNGRDLQTALGKLNLPAGTKAYNLACRKPVERIPKDYTGSVQALGTNLSPQKPVAAAIPFQGAVAEIYNEKGEKLPSKIKEGSIHFTTKSLGTFFIKTAKTPSKPVTSSGLRMKPQAKQKAVKPPKGQGPKHVKSTAPPPATSTSAPTAASSSTPEYSTADGDAPAFAEGAYDVDEEAVAGESTRKAPLNEEAMQEKERPGLIIFCLTIIFAALGGGAYMTRKYYRMYMDELIYEAERERESR